MEARLAQALTRLWAGKRPLLSGRGSAVAADLRRRYRLRLPAEFEAYLTDAAPEEDWMDGFGIIWWAPERIKSLRDECGAETPNRHRNSEIEAEADEYLVFADFLDWCYAFAICCSNGSNRGKVALIGASPDRFVSGSFCSFVELAGQDSGRLHSPAGDRFSDLA